MPRCPRVLAAIAVIAVLLVGCAGEGEEESGGFLVTTAERDAARCEAQGLEPGSTAHAACMDRAAAYRRLRLEHRGLATPGVRCTAGANAGGCF